MDCLNFPTESSQFQSEAYDNIPHIREANWVYLQYSHYRYSEVATDFVNVSLVVIASSTEEADCIKICCLNLLFESWKSSMLSVIELLRFSSLVPLKYDKEFNYIFVESLKIQLICLSISLFISFSLPRYNLCMNVR